MRKRLQLTLALVSVLGLALIASPLRAAPLVEESSEVSFPEIRKAGETSYRCLATGLRKVVFFKVYANTFCIEEGKAEAIVKAAVAANGEGKKGEDLAEVLEDSRPFFKAIFSSKADKLVVMHMVRDVSKEKLAEAFQDSLEKILAQASIDKLKALMTVDATEDMEVLFYSKGSKVFVEMGGKPNMVDDAQIAAKIWRVWLGPSSVTPGLRDDLAERASK